MSHHFLISCFFLLAVGCAKEPPQRTATTQAQGLSSRPLPPRAAVSGPLFSALPHTQTKIDFIHQWLAQERYPYDLETAMFGGGVALGDYDTDGLIDVYLTRPQGGNRLFRNLGNWHFSDATAASGIGETFWGQGASFVDIDNDGDLDLYACAHAGPNRLYVNNGDGTFCEAAKAFGLDFIGASVMMAFADYDLDGDLDGYLVTNHLNPPPGFQMGQAALTSEGRLLIPEQAREYRKALYDPSGKPNVIRAGQFDHLFRNDGGTFTDVSSTAGIVGVDHGLSATWWDADGDGDPDLYVANDFTDPDYFYRNNGDGTFTNVIAEALPHTPWFSMGTDAADINNDGLLDFIASDMSGTTHYNQKVGMGDMAENAWFLDHPTPRQYMRNAVYLNTGTSRFMEVASLTGLAKSDWSWSMNFADFDEDGWIDLYATNGMTRDWQNADLKAQAKALGGKNSPQGRAFWIAQKPKADPNLAFKNAGDLTFTPVGEAWGLNAVLATYGASTGDLDNDGDLDLVTVNFGEQASVYRNNASTSHRVTLKLRGTASNRWGIGARVQLTTATGTQTRELSLAHGFASAGTPALHFGLGEETLIQELSVTWPSGALQRFEALAADYEYTLTEPNSADAPNQNAVVVRWFAQASGLTLTKHRERPFNDFERQTLLPNKLSQFGPGLAAGDIDDDGDEDFFVGGAAGQMGSLYRNLGGGRFEIVHNWTASDDAESEDTAAVFFDADGDGDQDLYVVSGGVECDPGAEILRDRLYLNDGEGAFTKAIDALPDLRDSGSCVAIADFDQDGDVDAFVGGRSIPGRYPETPMSRLLLNDQGTFREKVEEALNRSGLVTAALWSDADGDGWVDLLVAHEWGPIKLWKNVQGRLTDQTEDGGLASRLGWWTGIAAADIDADGDTDYVVTNFGLNTKYHATPEHPVRLYYGDYDGSGTAHLIEAEFEGDVLFPVRGRSCSSNAIPVLRERFPSFQQFARATLSDIYTESKLTEARQFEANTLESGILVNDSNAHFEFRPLPRLAQASPGKAAAFADFDNDGHVDLYLVQNFFGPQPETGRMDGGVSLLLKGDGQGHFEPIWPNQSGLIVPGDATALGVADFDHNGASDLIIGLNNEAPMLFLRQ